MAANSASIAAEAAAVVQARPLPSSRSTRVSAPTEVPAAKRSLLDRLEQGPIVCAEGYLFELERRGYVQAGPFVPEVVLEHPEAVLQLHREFVRAGSDITLAFTYYAHREKLRLLGKEQLLEPMNRAALALARQVALETGTLFAGNICNTNLFDPDSKRSWGQVEHIFAEQVVWADEAGVDFVIGETFTYGQEALLALAAIKRAGLEAVITFGLQGSELTREGWSVAECAKRLEAAGADVVGLNCFRGPETMLPLLPELRAAVACSVAALPVPYRTTEASPSFESLEDVAGCCPSEHGLAFPTALDPFLCSRYELAEFAGAAKELGVDYLGVCCGAGPHHVRAIAEALGRRPEASRYSPDMAQHVVFGSDRRLAAHNRLLAADFRRRAPEVALSAEAVERPAPIEATRAGLLSTVNGRERKQGEGVQALPLDRFLRAMPDYDPDDPTFAAPRQPALSSSTPLLTAEGGPNA